MTITERIAEKTAARDRLNEEIAELEGRKRKYPYVGAAPISDEKVRIILFTADGSGVIIGPDERYPFGDKASDWREEAFHRFTGTIRYVDGQPVETREE